MLLVGFHRYVLENFNGETLEGVNEREVEKEFDGASEVCTLKSKLFTYLEDILHVLFPRKTHLQICRFGQ